MSDASVSIFPNPASDLLAVQINDLVKEDLDINLVDMKGASVKTAHINKGATIAYFDLQAVYEGAYVISVSCGGKVLLAKPVVIKKG